MNDCERLIECILCSKLYTCTDKVEDKEDENGHCKEFEQYTNNCEDI